MLVSSKNSRGRWSLHAAPVIALVDMTRLPRPVPRRSILELVNPAQCVGRKPLSRRRHQRSNSSAKYRHSRCLPRFPGTSLVRTCVPHRPLNLDRTRGSQPALIHLFGERTDDEVPTDSGEVTAIHPRALVSHPMYDGAIASRPEGPILPDEAEPRRAAQGPTLELFGGPRDGRWPPDVHATACWSLPGQRARGSRSPPATYGCYGGLRPLIANPRVGRPSTSPAFPGLVGPQDGHSGAPRLDTKREEEL